MKPLSRPITNTNTIASAAMPVVITKRNASSEEVWTLVVETFTVVIALAPTSPSWPPTRDSSSDSTRKPNSTTPWRKPSARSVPVSAVREAARSNDGLPSR